MFMGRIMHSLRVLKRQIGHRLMQKPENKIGANYINAFAIFGLGNNVTTSLKRCPKHVRPLHLILLLF